MYYKIENGSVNLGGRTILSNINFTIKDNDHIGIVGSNGCGKSTLVKAIAGIYDIEDGYDKCSIEKSKFKLGYVKQNDIYDKSMKMGDYIMEAYSDIIDIEKELRDMENIISKEYDEKVFNRYMDLTNSLEYKGGSTYKKEMEVALSKFGFKSSDKDKMMGEFSGGEITKISLIRLLLSKPDLLILDEPTNHLDIGSMEWLEEYLRSYKGSFILISHDRMILDGVCNGIYEIRYGELKFYRGNYSFFIKKRKEDYDKECRDYEIQRKEIKRLEEIVNRFRYKPSKASMAMSKLKMIERMDIINKPRSISDRSFNINIKFDNKSYRDVLKVKNLGIGYDRVMYRVNVNVTRGEKLAIMGNNGSGKSSFLKTIMGINSPLGGKYVWGDGCNIGYFSQDLSNLEMDKSVYEEIEGEYSNLSNYEIRSLLGSFGFSGDDVFKRIGDLSGGEKVRVSLCKIFYGKPNVLVMDEPTNHLDIVSRERIEDILRGYEGSIIMVSHDRYLVRNVASKVMVIGEGMVSYFDGYDDYIGKKRDSGIKRDSDVKGTQSVTVKKKEVNKERELKKLERDITSLEDRLSSLNEELLKEEVYMDGKRAYNIQWDIDVIKDSIDRKMKEWDKMVEEM